MSKPRRSVAAEAAFKARLAELGAVLLEPAWLGKDRPHRVRCAAGHDCWPRPGHVRGGRGICRTCVGDTPALAEAAFRARLAALGATLIEPAWLGVMRPHRVRCAAGHECHPKPNSVQQGQGVCRTCARRDPIAAEAAFKARLENLGATLLEPAWLGSDTPHHVRCASGHESRPRPGDVQQGDGICRTCAGKDRAVAEAAFRARLTELRAVLLEPVYLGNGRPHRVRCAAGHECRPMPTSVQRGQGICRVCSWSAQDSVYVVKHVSQPHIKFGITTGDGQIRLKRHARAGYETVIRFETGLPGVAAEIEQATIRALAGARMKPVRGREYYDLTALALILDIIDGWISAVRGHEAA